MRVLEAVGGVWMWGDAALPWLVQVQNVLDDVASILERCRGLVCWTDPTASTFFLLIGIVWALGVAVLGLHTILSGLLCWMVRALHV